MDVDGDPVPGTAAAVALDRAEAVIRLSNERLDSSRRRSTSSGNALERRFDALIGKRPAPPRAVRAAQKTDT